MSILYVTQPGAEVRCRGARLRVEWQGQVLMALPVRKTQRVVLLGPAQLSSAAIRMLLRRRIPVHFCSMRGRCYGSLGNGSEDVELLLQQVTCYQDQAFRLEQAKAIVKAKNNHQRQLLMRHARNHPQPNLKSVSEQLKLLNKQLQEKASISEIMGIEGRASALYFSVFDMCLRQDDVSFAGRNRRPPKDPVNAVLSLGYMIVLQEVISALTVHGLQTGLGFLHEASRRRPALALDLLELARQPIVDRLTLSLFNLKVLRVDDFQHHSDGGVRLKERSLKRYLQLYEKAMTTTFRFHRDGPEGTFRDWIQHEAKALRKSIQAHALWTPQMLEL